MATINDKIQLSALTRLARLISVPILLFTYSSAMAFDDDYRSRRDGISQDAGDAIANNKAIHTIDPWPYHANDANLETSGRRIEHAITRYQTDKVKDPRGLRNSEEGVSEWGSQGTATRSTTE